MLGGHRAPKRLWGLAPLSWWWITCLCLLGASLGRAPVYGCVAKPIDHIDPGNLSLPSIRHHAQTCTVSTPGAVSPLFVLRVNKTAVIYVSSNQPIFIMHFTKCKACPQRRFLKPPSVSFSSCASVPTNKDFFFPSKYSIKHSAEQRTSLNYMSWSTWVLLINKTKKVCLL